MGGGIKAKEVRNNMRQLSKWFLSLRQLLPVDVLVDRQGYTSVRVTGELGRPTGGQAEVGGGMAVYNRIRLNSRAQNTKHNRPEQTKDCWAANA